MTNVPHKHDVFITGWYCKTLEVTCLESHMLELWILS